MEWISEIAIRSFPGIGFLGLCAEEFSSNQLVSIVVEEEFWWLVRVGVKSRFSINIYHKIVIYEIRNSQIFSHEI